jgi:hypothetical protein
VSRIRSIHPGIWTDEAFVTLSAHARVFLIGLWTEADDKGIFPWSPLKLKMRLLPADNVDVAGLLAELVDGGLVLPYECEGKTYAAIRNFTRFQRPKKPNDIHPATEQALLFAGHDTGTKEGESKKVPAQAETSSEPVPHQSENPPADGGWRMEDGIRTPKGVCASGDAPGFTANDFVESWNEAAAACGLAKIRKLTDARRRAFAVRRREYPEIADWQSAFRCLVENKWMHGDNPKGWRADPDFFLQSKSFTKLVEGQYGQADRP